VPAPEQKASDQSEQAESENQEYSDAEMEVNLGPCHYGGTEEEATITASREDGTGWIAVCDDHVQQAKDDGFVPSEAGESD
jgi:hypothetical protein